MTEKLQPLSTQIVTPSQTVLPLQIPITAQHAIQKVETVEEEPYTIKCICDFPDDDGNTIYCETCETWQHIECFYPDNVEDALREDFSHSCADCKPRPLDKQQAVERQRSRLTMPVLEEEANDKKPKRPPSKSHKKKPKPTDLQLNGHPPGSETTKHPSPNDPHPPAKKAKNSHKATHSISSQAAKRSPSYGNPRSNANGHPPSPANTPPDLPNDLEIHNYSSGFLSLYNDNDVQTVSVNSFASLKISNTMSLWLREPETMREQTGHEFGDVFQPLPTNIDSLKRPLHVEHKKVLLTPDVVLRWEYLTTPSAIDKDVPLIELNGQIGIQKEYCDDPENRWDQLSSPLPFVFFHPMLPLYVDTRREGSRARYVRRSCKPNAVLDTYLSGGSEYHFWLVSDRAIAANEQITIPWDFRLPNHSKARMLRILGLRDDETGGGHGEPEIDEAEYQHIASWVHLILSEYGGCACHLGSECAFARFHRNYHGKAQVRNNPAKKKSRKPKTHTISPTSTGRATNSRAASEGHLDDVPEQDGRSVSGSSRSKPPSRDMTPARQGSFDTPGILTQPTDRDKRKVAMVEDSFRRMEQQQPPRKKKRTSDGTGGPGPSKPRPTIRHPAGQPGLPNGVPERRYIDAGTSRSKSGSPASATSPNMMNPIQQSSSRHGSAPAVSRRVSAAPRANYIDACVQTDPVEGEWYSGSGRSPRPRKRIVSLSKRLLDNRHKLRMVQGEQSNRDSPSQEASLSSPVDVDSPATNQKAPLGSPSAEKDGQRPLELVSPAVAGSGDTPMPDAPSPSPGIKAPPAPPMTSPISTKSPELRVQMPPIPAFGSPSTVTTPLSATGSMVQSPFSATNLPSPFAPPSVNGIAANPSPVKKKLSLSDYTKSRMNKAAGARPSVGTTSLKPSTSNADDPKSAISVDTSAAADSPTAEKADSIAPATGSAAAPVNGAMQH